MSLWSKKCVVDRYKWLGPFQMETTVLRNGNDRFKWQRGGNTRNKPSQLAMKHVNQYCIKQRRQLSGR